MRIMEAWSARVVVTRFMDTQCSHHVELSHNDQHESIRETKSKTKMLEISCTLSLSS